MKKLKKITSDGILLRGIIALVAISVIVPGLLRVDPPSWLNLFDAHHQPGDAIEARAALAGGSEDDAVAVHSAEAAVDATPIIQVAQALIPTAKPEVDENGLAIQDISATTIPNAPAWFGRRVSSQETIKVPRDFVTSIHPSHVDLQGKRRKDSFIATTLPLILAANEEILERRKDVLRAIRRGDRKEIDKWAKLYRVKSEGRDIEQIEKDLLPRVDTIPVSLAIAQGAIESAWGTSRFALQGNALFGQWAWQKNQGIAPKDASNDRAVIRSFPNLLGSVRAYMHNLNTHPAYSGFRERRLLIRDRGRLDAGFQLAAHLTSYAATGEVYVKSLRQLIRSNDLGRFENAELR